MQAARPAAINRPSAKARSGANQTCTSPCPPPSSPDSSLREPRWNRTDKTRVTGQTGQALRLLSVSVRVHSSAARTRPDKCPGLSGSVRVKPLGRGGVGLPSAGVVSDVGIGRITALASPLEQKFHLRLKPDT